MPSWLKSLTSKAKGKGRAGSDLDYDAPPPEWQAAPEPVHTDGLLADASEADYQAAEVFCERNPPHPSRLLSSDAIDRIRRLGCGAWQLEEPATKRFRGRIEPKKKGAGTIRVVTAGDCEDVCIFSDLPLLAGLYETRGRPGVYYEIKIVRMDGVIAVGLAARPYPEWRLPGWNRLSGALHLDDCRKFFEDPDGGRDYIPGFTAVSPGDTVGVGFTWANGAIFFTHNGRRLPDAFTGTFMPREFYDVYAALGVSGPGACEFEVNFGAGSDFEWKEGNNWKVEGHVGMLSSGSGGADDELPSYQDARMDQRITYQ